MSYTHITMVIHLQRLHTQEPNLIKRTLRASCYCKQELHPPPPLPATNNLNALPLSV
jgi:hypothetical protein